MPDPNIFLWIAAFAVAAAAVNQNGIKTILANGFSTIFIKGIPDFSNVPKSPPKNLPDCSILCNWIFDNYTLVDELFGKSLQSSKNCVLINDNLCRKLFSSLE